MFTTTNPPNPDSVNEDAIEALNQFIAGEQNAVVVGRLSDLDRTTLQAAFPLWSRIPTDVRRFVVHQMLEQAEANVELNFNRLLIIALDDPDSEIRSLAIQGLWEDESTTFLERLLRMLEHEPEPIVREAIAEALGTFSVLAFEEALEPKWGDAIRSALFDVYQSRESIGVRKKALISLACFSDDPEVETAIHEAFASPYHDLQTAAVFAMGINLDDQWFETLLQATADEDPEMRFEAVRAIGRFGDERAISTVLDLLDDEDREVQLAAIEALGEIGGKTAMATLRRFVKSDDVVISEAADEALHEATIVSGSVRLNP